MAKVKEESEVFSQLDALESLVDINKMLDKKAQEQGILFSTMEKENRIKGGVSTGVLSFDLIMGGGYAPGTFSYLFGPTGSCKSTLLYHTVREAIAKQMIASYHDHECSADPTYLSKIGVDLDKVCGFRNKKGEWEVTPQLRYSVGITAESTFKYMNMVMKSLPDKIVMADPTAKSNRYFLIDPTYDYALNWKSINAGLKDGKVKEVDANSPQVIFLIDSLKAMLPEARDEDFDKDPIAMAARTFHQCFPLIKSLLGRKNCLLVATNHITINPMAKFGNPESEPGGSAVQFYPDFKMKLYINRAQNKIVEEEHVSGEGVDRYFPGSAMIMKNKFGPSFKKAEFRLWLDERGEPGRGIDPVFDTFNFLKSCQYIDGDMRNSFKITMTGYSDVEFDWSTFKKFILELDDGKKLINQCHALLNDGTAQERFYENLRNGGSMATVLKPDKEDKEKVKEVEL